jgi:hypothetical protein
MTYSSIDAPTRDLILELISREALQPTEVLSRLEAKSSFNKIQDALAILLDQGIIEMNSERRLSMSQIPA